MTLVVLLGNDQDAANRSVLRSHGISHVINVTSHVPLHFESDGVKYLRFPASDTGFQNLRQYFEEAVCFIGERCRITRDPSFPNCKINITGEQSLIVINLNYKRCDPLLARAIPERFRDEFLMIKHYTNAPCGSRGCK